MASLRRPRPWPAPSGSRSGWASSRRCCATRQPPPWSWLRWHGVCALARERIDGGRAEADRHDPHQLVVYALLGVGAQGQQAVRAELAGALRQNGSAQLGPAETEGADALATLAASALDTATLAAELPASWVEQLAVTGTPDQCALAVQRYHQAGADTVVLVSPREPRAATQQLDQAAAQVLPRLR